MGSESLKTYLLHHLVNEARNFWGEKDTDYLARVADDWLDETGESGSHYRIERIRSLQSTLSSILDLGSGCGTFVRYALRLGINAWGVEPQDWKRTVSEEVLHRDGAPLQVVGGVGEKLPFNSDSFDCVTTFQTLEHVQDLYKCCREMVRVTRPGGGIYIRCPDYQLSTYEGHYRLPWLPGLWGKQAERYLQWRGKPLAGLYSLLPVSARMLRTTFSAVGRDLRVNLTCNNVDYSRIRERLHLPDHTVVRVASAPLFLAHYLRLLFRGDYSVHLFVRVGRKGPQ